MRSSAPSDPLYAIGLFRTVGGSQELPNTAEEVRLLLNRWKRSPDILKIFDKNGDGKIDVHEWEVVRRTAHQQVKREQSERFHQAVFNMLSKPEDSRRPYLLSVYPQDKLVGRYRLYAGLCTVVFLFAGTTASWLFEVRF